MLGNHVCLSNYTGQKKHKIAHISRKRCNNGTAAERKQQQMTRVQGHLRAISWSQCAQREWYLRRWLD